MLLLGAWLFITAKGRRIRVESAEGDKSIA